VPGPSRALFELFRARRYNREIGIFLLVNDVVDTIFVEEKALKFDRLPFCKRKASAWSNTNAVTQSFYIK
jgi:hypothetical protein